MSLITALQISPGTSAPALSPAQKRFNTLIRQIERARTTLSAWKEHAAAYHQAHTQVLLPLQSELLAGHRQWVFALDGLLGRKTWKKTERDTLRRLVCEAAGELLDARPEDAELKAVFDRHSEVDFDTEQREAMLAMKEMAEAMTGLDFGDDEELETEEDLLLRMQRGMQEQAQAEEEAERERASRRRKTPARQRREAEAQQVTQSVREIYRKLASALHPDREPEGPQRVAKTLLMQRVNQAYEAADLLALLELQLEIEQIDASHIAQASASKLKHYNKVLSEQLDELKLEIEQVELGFRMESMLEFDGPMNADMLVRLIDQRRRQWQAELKRQQRDMQMLDDVEATRRWLKQQRQRIRRDEERSTPF